MTYADGFHRRGLVGTIFQFFAGDQPRPEQYTLASDISAVGVYLFLAAGFALFVYGVARVRDRAFGTAAPGFAALAFINPMWTTRAHDNGYLDWLAGLCVTLALAAFAFRRPWLSGAVAAVGIVAYWGTLFVWLPLGFLIFCALARDMFTQDDALPLLSRLLAACRRREAVALWLPPAVAILVALAHDNGAAIAQLRKIGGQEHIMKQVFSGVGKVFADQLAWFAGWRQPLAMATVFALPAALGAGLWAHILNRRGLALISPGWPDIAAAVVATMAFLLVAFDTTRLMAWTYLGALVVMLFWLLRAKPRGEPRPGALWPWALAPAVVAAIFWTSPTIYGWRNMTYVIPCDNFCFKERTFAGRAMDAYRRQVLALPILEYRAPGAALPEGGGGMTGHNENGYRVARAGRDRPGRVMNLNFRLNEETEGVTVRGAGQVRTPIIGRGPHRITINYRAHETQKTNAETAFAIYSSSLGGSEQLLRMPLSPAQTTFSAIIEAPPELAGNLFRWGILYNGEGVFELRDIVFEKLEDLEG